MSYYKATEAVAITHTGSTEWQSAAALTLNSVALTSDQYSWDNGKLTLNGSLFPVSGNYTLVASAAGYADSTAAISVYPANGDLIKNGDFTDGQEYWSAYNHNGASCELDYTKGYLDARYLHAEGDSWGNMAISWSIQSNQKDIVVPADGTYELHFMASSEVERYIISDPGEDIGNDPNPPLTDKPFLFADVGDKDWYYDAVQYVFGNNMMFGTAVDQFSPDMSITRGMAVTILYRLEGEPAVTASPFSDVAEGQYYANAVAWAASAGVVSGYGNNTFGPEDLITREQMATILYRYAAYKKYDVSGMADLFSFVDAQKISGYAVESMSWANATGLILVRDGNSLAPDGTATRAEAAMVLMRFCENVVAKNKIV